MTLSSVTYLYIPCSWNRQDVITLCKKPRQRHLSASSIVFVADLLKGINEREDVREVFFGETKNRWTLHMFQCTMTLYIELTEGRVVYRRPLRSRSVISVLCQH